MSGMSTSQPITLTDHAEDSNESELTSSIRRLQSTVSLPAITNTRITFAPLPLIEPHKRRSTSHVKLGVSARSSMMRQPQLAVENFNDTGEGSQPREQPRGREERWGGALKKLPPGSETWQDPRTKTHNEHTADSDVVFLAMGRLVKNAWRRVSQTRAPSSTPLNRPVESGDVKLEKELDANKIPSEPEEELESEWEENHEKSPEQIPSVEDEALGSLGNAPIHLETKKRVPSRSASEPRRTDVHV